MCHFYVLIPLITQLDLCSGVALTRTTFKKIMKRVKIRAVSFRLGVDATTTLLNSPGGSEALLDSSDLAVCILAKVGSMPTMLMLI